jgi:hypothetical protein
VQATPLGSVDRLVDGLGHQWTGAQDPMLCHRCDSHGCTNPAHLRIGTAAKNRAEWAQRHRDPTGPLADCRGPAARTRAIAQAVLAGLAAGDTAAAIDERYRRARGCRQTPDPVVARTGLGPGRAVQIFWVTPSSPASAVLPTTTHPARH